MNNTKSKMSHIVALALIAAFISFFYLFGNAAGTLFAGHALISEILFLLIYIFFIAFISWYTLKNHLKFEFVIFAVFTLIISNILIIEAFMFCSDIMPFDQKEQYYYDHALFALCEPYGVVVSTVGTIIVHIAPIIPFIFLIFL